jgi:hypothetical protein
MNQLMGRVGILLCVVAWLPCMGDAPAYAQAPAQSDAARERALKTLGDAAMDALRYDDALRAYRDAYAILKNPALLYNQSRALEAHGEYADALTYLEQFEAAAPAALKARVPGLQDLDAILRSHVTMLTVHTNVAGASIVLRGASLGRSPMPDGVRASYAHATLLVAADKYVSQSRELELPGGGALTVDVELVRAAVTGVLAIRSLPGARVTIDGKVAGGVPLESALAPGRHSIIVERPGYFTVQTSAEVALGERNVIEIPLVSTPALYTRWWFWTAAGVAVAAGVASYVIATTERSADQGTISPGRVLGPQVTFR